MLLSFLYVILAVPNQLLTNSKMAKIAARK
jgi:hypothetical protein